VIDLVAMKRARWGQTRHGEYRVVLADPPWKFRDSGSRITPSYEGKGRALRRYAQVDDNRRILDMGDLVWRLGAPDSLLFLWCPNALIVDGTATKTCEAWGYEPKQLIPWLKVGSAGRPLIRGGHYTRVCTEQMVLATRGRASQLVTDRGVPGFISARPGRHSGGHSAKPDESYRLIERLVALGPYLELFARRRWSEEWTVLGDEIAFKEKLC
jgi:N6-adenosine-specific RNA methylase IME4